MAFIRKVPRSPERQRLAEAIERLGDAQSQADRVAAARERLDDDLFERLHPAQRAAEKVVEELREGAPAALVDRLMGDAEEEAEAGPTLAEAEAKLAAAEKAISDARSAQSMLYDEATRAEQALHLARGDLESAYRDALRADPAVAALAAELDRQLRRAARVARAIKALPENAVPDSVPRNRTRVVDGIGFTVGFNGIAAPDPAWLAALSALRDDPDAALPAMPEPDPEPEAAAA